MSFFLGYVEYSKGVEGQYGRFPKEGGKERSRLIEGDVHYNVAVMIYE